MAAFEVLSLDTAIPQIRAPGAGDTYTFPRQALFLAGTVSAPGIAQTSNDNTGMWWPAANTLAWSINGGEAMRLDSSGNLGLGVTPSAWGSTYRALDVRTAAIYDTPAGTASGLTFNAIYNGTNWVYKGTGGNASALRYEQGAAQHQWFTAPSGTAGNTISFTQAMTLDASGNLGVGLTNPVERLALYDASQPTLGFRSANFTYVLDLVDVGGNFRIRRNDLSTAVRLVIPLSGGLVVGNAALATNATDGFLYVPTCAGTPTGTPTAQTGTAPIVVDTTNNKLYFYSGGQWRDAGP